MRLFGFAWVHYCAPVCRRFHPGLRGLIHAPVYSGANIGCSVHSSSHSFTRPRQVRVGSLDPNKPHKERGSVFFWDTPNGPGGPDPNKPHKPRGHELFFKIIFYYLFLLLGKLLQRTQTQTNLTNSGGPPRYFCENIFVLFFTPADTLNGHNGPTPVRTTQTQGAPRDFYFFPLRTLLMDPTDADPNEPHKNRGAPEIFCLFLSLLTLLMDPADPDPNEPHKLRGAPESFLHIL